MKNLFYFLLVAVMVVMNSCYCGGGFNEPQVPFSSNDIFGVWYGSQNTSDLYGYYVFYENGTYGKGYVSTCHDKIPDILDGTYTFEKSELNKNCWFVDCYTNDNHIVPLIVIIKDENTIIIDDCKYIRYSEHIRK